MFVIHSACFVRKTMGSLTSGSQLSLLNRFCGNYKAQKKAPKHLFSIRISLIIFSQSVSLNHCNAIGKPLLVNLI